MTNLIIYGNINSKGFPQTPGKESGRRRERRRKKIKGKYCNFAAEAKTEKKNTE